MDTIGRRVAQVERETLLRLADRAEREGVRVLLTADGAHFATSRSNPTMLHRVGVGGCDCRGWQVWRRCGHNALLLAELGLIADGDPEPAPTLSAIALRVKSDTVSYLALAVVSPVGYIAGETVNLTHLPPVRCPSCAGRGFTWAHEPGVQPFTRTCSPCRATGQVKVNVLVGERELRPVA